MPANLDARGRVAKMGPALRRWEASRERLGTAGTAHERRGGRGAGTTRASLVSSLPPRRALPCTLMAVTFERVAPVFPVRNVARALELYRKLGFKVDAYGEPGTSESDPIYGFLSWGPVELHLSRFAELDPKT